MKWLKDILTDDTGLTFTPDKVLWAIGVVAFIGYAGWDLIVNKQPFDALKYGGGLGATLAGGGSATWLASRQKPTGEQ